MWLMMKLLEWDKGSRTWTPDWDLTLSSNDGKSLLQSIVHSQQCPSHHKIFSLSPILLYLHQAMEEMGVSFKQSDRGILTEASTKDWNCLCSYSSKPFHYGLFCLASATTIHRPSKWPSVNSLDTLPVFLSRPDKSGRARISGHLGKIARIMPGFLWFCPDFCDFARIFVI